MPPGAERAIVELLFRTEGAAVGFVDRDLRFLRVNRALADMNGAPVEAHPGRRIRDIIGRGADAIEPLVRGVIETGEPVIDLAVVADAPGGGKRHLLATYYPVRDEQGVLTGVAALIGERTPPELALRQTEQQLRAREALLRAVLQNLPVGVIIAEAPTGRMLHVNAQAQAIWRHPPHLAADVGAYALYEGFHPDGRLLAPHEWPLARAVMHGETVLGETIEFRRGDGTMGTMRVSATPIDGDDGEVATAVVVFEDVTPQREIAARERTAREAAEQAVARTRSLLALTEALAGARSVDDVAQVVVAQAVAATGSKTGMLVVCPPGADHAVIVRQTGFPEDIIARFRRMPLDTPGPAALSLRTGEPVWVSGEGEDTLAARFPELAEVWRSTGVSAVATVPLVVAGDTVGAMSFTFESPRALPEQDRDFFLALGRQSAQAVERARLFAAEQAARGDAEAANRAKSDFLAVMSHELRTPLNAIGGYAELIELGIRGPVTEQQREDLRRIQRSQKHLLGLINEVLNYARLETGAVRYEIAAVAVHEAILEAEGLVAPQAHAKGLEMRTDEREPGLTVEADVEKLRQILVNVLSNAVKFTDRGGSIIVEARRADDRVAIRVRDTGVGIPDDRLEAIFEPFVQVRADLTRTAEGTGLGLAISRDLARGMGGDLTVESALGEGSTFTLVLPPGSPG